MIKCFLWSVSNDQVITTFEMPAVPEIGVNILFSDTIYQVLSVDIWLDPIGTIPGGPSIVNCVYLNVK